MADNIDRSLGRLGSVVRRAEREGLGRNAEGSRMAARRNYGQAFAAILALEDADGIDAAAAAADTLTDLRQRATRAGLMEARDVLRAEGWAV